MKFLCTVELETSGECYVEAPSLEAAEAWMEAERVDRFRNWFLDQNDGGYYVHVAPAADSAAVDIRVNAEGREIE